MRLLRACCRGLRIRGGKDSVWDSHHGFIAGVFPRSNVNMDKAFSSQSLMQGVYHYCFQIKSKGLQRSFIEVIY